MQTDRWTCRQTDGHANRRTDIQTDIWTCRQTDGHADKWTDMHRRTRRQTDGHADRRMDLQTDRRTEIQTNGRTDRRTDGHADRRTNIKTDVHIQTDERRCRRTAGQADGQRTLKSENKTASLAMNYRLVDVVLVPLYITASPASVNTLPSSTPSQQQLPLTGAGGGDALVAVAAVSVDGEQVLPLLLGRAVAEALLRVQGVGHAVLPVRGQVPEGALHLEPCRQKNLSVNSLCLSLSLSL